ncbi:hypothetical protein J6590_014327 [Homalodisca vitripennis]|nr:hypothetical protein J6590_014327 [Homalodisca vitripennis]
MVNNTQVSDVPYCNNKIAVLQFGPDRSCSKQTRYPPESFPQSSTRYWVLSTVQRIDL